MLAVKGYYDGKNYITDEAVSVKPNQRVIITFLDESEPLTSDAVFKKQQRADSEVTLSAHDSRIQAINNVFGMLSHEEAEEIRSNRVNFKERF